MCALFYPNKFPKPLDMVIGNVKQIQESFIYVQLIEYNLPKDAMLIKSEISRKRLFNVKQLIRVGKDEVFRVQRVDEINGYVDLSKLDISPEEHQKCIDLYVKAKFNHSLATQLAGKVNMQISDMLTMVVWPLYERFQEENCHLSNADKVYYYLNNAKNNPDCLDYINNQEIQHILMNILQLKFKSVSQKIRTVLNITSFTYRGIDDIIDAFREIDHPDVSSSYIAAPLYSLTIEHVDPEKGIAILQHNNDRIMNFIQHAGGECSVYTAPHVVNGDQFVEEQEADQLANKIIHVDE